MKSIFTEVRGKIMTINDQIQRNLVNQLLLKYEHIKFNDKNQQLNLHP